MARASSSKYIVCPQMRCIASFALMVPFIGIASALALGSNVQHAEVLCSTSCLLCLYGFRGIIPGDGKPLPEYLIDIVALFCKGSPDNSS